MTGWEVSRIPRDEKMFVGVCYVNKRVSARLVAKRISIAVSIDLSDLGVESEQLGYRSLSTAYSPCDSELT